MLGTYSGVYNFVIPVEDSSTGGPMPITVVMEYLLFNSHTVNFA